MYEDCFNGIDDDGDRLIDRQDVFDCWTLIIKSISQAI